MPVHSAAALQEAALVAVCTQAYVEGAATSPGKVQGQSGLATW
jgi:hypothetical protein